MAENEKDGVFGRGGGWETGKNWMGNLMGHEICQGCWKGPGRYIGRVIARGREGRKFGRVAVRGLSFWIGSWKGAIVREFWYGQWDGKNTRIRIGTGQQG